MPFSTLAFPIVGWGCQLIKYARVALGARGAGDEGAHVSKSILPVFVRFLSLLYLLKWRIEAMELSRWRCIHNVLPPTVN